MRTGLQLAFSVLTLIAACAPAAPPAGDGPAETAQTAEARGQAAVRLETGLWRTSITIQEMTVPGMPAEIAQGMIGQTTTVEACRTSDDPAAATEEWAQGRGGCAAGTVTISGDRFQGERVCTDEGMRMTLRFNGTLSPSRIEGETQMSGQTPMGAIAQRAAVVSERVGACPG